MRKLYLLVTLSLLSLGLSGCNVIGWNLDQALRGSGNVTTEQRTVGTFKSIDVSGIGEVQITAGNTEGLMVETDDNLQAVVLSEIRGTTLHLHIKPKVQIVNATRITYIVTVRDLEQITLSGAATIKARDLRGEHLIVNHSGVGEMAISGNVQQQEVTLSGMGNYHGAELVSNQASINVSGMGDVIVHVRERLDATLSGAGTIEYIGNPEVKTQISGLGQIRQRTS